MNKLFSFLLAGTLLAGVVATVGAQGAGPKGQKAGQAAPGAPNAQRRGNMVDLMKQVKPPLTADQTKKVDAINQKFRADMQKLRGNGQPGRGGAQRGAQSGQRPDMAKFQELVTKRNEAINKVLTKPQQESYKKLTEDMMKRFQQNRPGGPAGAKPPAAGKAGSKAGSGKGG